MNFSNTFGWRHSVLAAVMATLAGFGQAQTALNDIPMIVSNSVAPNFMFMIDNSGSMDAIVAERNRDAVNPYDAATDYTPLGCTGTNVVAAGSTVNLVVVSGAPRFTINGGSNMRHFTLATTGTDRRCFARNSAYNGELLNNSSMNGTYSGNYLNWYFGNAGGHPVTGWGDRKVLNRLATAGGGTMLVSRRIDVVRTATNRVIDSLPNPAVNGESKVRVGLSAYYNGDGNRGGRLLAPIRDLTGTSLTDTTNTTTAVGRGAFKSVVNGLSAGGATPLASTLADIGRYFATGSTTATMPTGSVNLDGDGGLLRVSGTDQTTARNACLTTGTGADRSTCTSAATRRPVQYWCQRSYAFFLTDGLPNGDRAFNNNALLRDYDRDCTGASAANCVNSGAAGSWDRKTARTYLSAGSDYLDDVAKALFDADLRPDLVKPAVANDPNLSAYDNWKRQNRNNVRTYPMGFADPIVANDPLLVNTGAQGGGRFVSAADETALDREFKSVISDAFAKESAAAAVGVATTQLTTDNVGYLGSFIPGAWTGSLKAFSLNASTASFIEPPLWDFAVKLRQQVAANGWQSRKIVSIKANLLGVDQGVAFTPANFALQPSTLLPEVIDFIRGDESRDGRSIPDGAAVPIFTFRDRQDLLGDIINAEPVVIEEGGVKYLFQAANDGMLHVINAQPTGAGAGEELWAYVPRLIHANLHDLASASYVHKYFVDATPAVANLGSGGIRLLVGGLGKGGRGYYALDVSNPAATSVADAASKVKWEFTDADMGLTYGTPEIVRVANTSIADGWRVVVTSGHNNSSGRGYVYVLNPNTGAVISKIDTGVGTAAAPAGLTHLSRMAYTAPDATLRYLYGGDLLGNVWRVDLDSLTVTRIAQLTGVDGQVQPVTAPVEVGPVLGTTSKVYVYVGTGKYLSDGDVPGSPDATAQALYRQSMYGIIDDLTVTAPTMPNIRGTNGTSCPSGGGDGAFVCQALTPHPTVAGAYNNGINTVDSSVKRGWYIDWPADANLSGARVFGKPALSRGGTVVIAVNVPNSAKCSPGGRAYLLNVYGQTGGAVPKSKSNTTSTSLSDYYSASVRYQGEFLTSRARLVTGSGISLPTTPPTPPGPPCGTPGEPPCPCSAATASMQSTSSSAQLPTGVQEGCDPTAAWRRIQFRSVK
jgi:type IV pilus assembly protein PilY1